MLKNITEVIKKQAEILKDYEKFVKKKKKTQKNKINKKKQEHSKINYLWRHPTNFERIRSQKWPPIPTSEQTQQRRYKAPSFSKTRRVKSYFRLQIWRILKINDQNNNKYSSVEGFRLFTNAVRLKSKHFRVQWGSWKLVKYAIVDIEETK